MSYIAPKDYSEDPGILEAVMRRMAGDLDLGWITKTGEPAAYRPSHPDRGLTLDDINGGGYSPDHLPEIIRHNFSMAPRGALLPDGLPSLGYTLNRKSEVWSDIGAALFEEGKSRHWAPARDVPWEALAKRDRQSREERAMRQIATSLTSIGLVSGDTAARYVWRMNIEFHEIKYLLCGQMLDGARIAEAWRKRALFGSGSLGVDSQALGELLKTVFDADGYLEASSAMNLVLMGFVQALGRELEYRADNAADERLAVYLMQDASRFLSYGVDHVRSALRVRPGEAERLNGHLDLVENTLVGALGAPEIIEPLVVLTGGLEPVIALYERLVRETFERCAAAGLGDRGARSPMPDFLAMLRGEGEAA